MSLTAEPSSAAGTSGDDFAPHAADTADVVSRLGTDPATGLSAPEAAQRLATLGPNQITGEKPPSVWAVALQQLRDPMNIMLVAVTVVSFLIGEVSTGVIVGAAHPAQRRARLAPGAQGAGQRRRAVEAAGARRPRWCATAQLTLVPAVDVVPGDIVQLEAGDIVPADGRIVRSATLEAQEAALTGESAPIAKDAATLASADVALGDRTEHAVPEHLGDPGHGVDGRDGDGHGDPDGPDRHDADLGHPHPVAAAEGARLPDQGARASSPGRRSRSSSSSGSLAAMPASELLLLGTAMAISAIPTGLPAFVSGLLSMGAKQLADAKAVVKNLTDVETLGATSAINTDKTGTLTMNQMMVSTLYATGSWFTVEGEGYRKTGAIRSVAGAPVPDFTRLALGLVLDSDATVADDGAVVGDPTEAALVVLAAKLGVDAEETRRAYPRLAEVPFDSEYKFMATFHRVAVDGRRAA